MPTGLVFDIQRFCTHDGPGIRTVVFLKGCPLDCIWCHNPESKSSRKELFYNPGLCIGCGYCAEVCPKQAHVIVDGTREFIRERCQRCTRCTEGCYSGALEAVGREMDVDQAYLEVEKDRIFYEESGGGMTLSGGEPMLQFEFTRDLLRKTKEAGVSTCIETSGTSPAERFLEIVPYVDLFLWDIKDTDPERLKRNTGADLGTVLANLRAVDAAGGITQIRGIILEGINASESHIDALVETRRSLEHCEGIELLPYHPLGASKSERLGLSPRDDASWEPTAERMALCRGVVGG